MSKPPSKGETPPPAKARPEGGKIHITRAAAAATSYRPVLNTRTPKESPASKEPQGSPVEAGVMEREHPSGDVTLTVPPLLRIENIINSIIAKETLSRSIKASLEGLLKIIHKEKEKEGSRIAKITAAAEEGAIRKSIRADIEKMHNAIEIQLNSIQNTASATLTSSSKLLKDTESVAAATKDLTGKVGKITDTADRIATDTSKYRDAVLSRPTQTLRF
jgi:methyl-accepting chemotaxis protein